MSRRHSVPSALLLLSLGAAACGAPGKGGDGNDGPPTTFGGPRPTTLKVPSTYDPATPAPLLIVLHGYGIDGITETGYMGLGALIEEDGVLLAAPDGTIDAQDKRFWNAGPACCDGFGSGVDDEGYLASLIDEIGAAYTVDPGKVFVIGHSAGAFMAHRMACDDADRIAAIVSLNGSEPMEDADCHPARAVSVLDLHGTDDQTILYDGGQIASVFIPYPSEPVAMGRWGARDGCTGALTDDTVTLDIDQAQAGNETHVSYVAGCPAGVDVNLWTMQGSYHLPNPVAEFAHIVWRWMKAHGR